MRRYLINKQMIMPKNETNAIIPKMVDTSIQLKNKLIKNIAKEINKEIIHAIIIR